MAPPPTTSTLFPYTTLFRSEHDVALVVSGRTIGSSPGARARGTPNRPDRKSTRLNSSHVEISYAVFCLKKKNGVIVIRSNRGQAGKPRASDTRLMGFSNPLR